MSKAYLGIDVSKEKLDVALLAEKLSSNVFANTEKGYKSLARWLDKKGVKELHTCMETTGRYANSIARFLYDQGHEVSVVNPFRVHNYRKSRLVRNKTDKIDAGIIAHFRKAQPLELWQPPKDI